MKPVKTSSLITNMTPENTQIYDQVQIDIWPSLQWSS